MKYYEIITFKACFYIKNMDLTIVMSFYSEEISKEILELPYSMIIFTNHLSTLVGLEQRALDKVIIICEPKDSIYYLYKAAKLNPFERNKFAWIRNVSDLKDLPNFWTDKIKLTSNIICGSEEYILKLDYKKSLEELLLEQKDLLPENKNISMHNKLISGFQYFLINKIRSITPVEKHDYFNHTVINLLPLIKISIIMTACNRSEQTYFTLRTINQNSENQGVQIVIVDDSSIDPILKSSLTQFNKLQINLISIKNKCWVNPVVNYNIGFKFISSETQKIIIQNAEVCHVGNVIKFVSSIEEGKYYVFDVKNSISFENNQLIYNNYPLLVNTEIYNTLLSTNNWYQHSKENNRLLHFLACMSYQDFQKINEFSYDYCYEIDYDDDDWLLHIVSKGITVVPVDNTFFNVGGIHQYHHSSTLISSRVTNRKIYLNRLKLYNQTNIYSDSVSWSNNEINEIDYNEELLQIYIFYKNLGSFNKPRTQKVMINQANINRLNGNFTLAYQQVMEGLESSHGNEFLDKELYKQLSIICFYIKKMDYGLLACDKVILSKAATKEDQELTLRNTSFYLTKVSLPRFDSYSIDITWKPLTIGGKEIITEYNLECFETISTFEYQEGYLCLIGYGENYHRLVHFNESIIRIGKGFIIDTSEKNLDLEEYLIHLPILISETK